ncbi:MAG: TIM barrel protein [Verrucomicrobiota bacterium JB023]|nr:TIM barrel protein [Verrucomicrobiota bacterium JB023]
MERRQFLHTALAGGSLIAASGIANAQEAEKAQLKEDELFGKKFKMKYAPHAGHFKNHAGADYFDQMKFASEVGFTAWEDNFLGRKPPEFQEKVGKTLADLGMTMGVFVAQYPTKEACFANPTQQQKDEVLQRIKDSLEVAKRVNCTWMTVVPGNFVNNLEFSYQTANAIDLLRRCAEILEPEGKVMVLEPLNPWTNHAGCFLAKIPHAYEICRGVNSPSCKILNDLYHQQIAEGNLIDNYKLAKSEIAYIQTGDNPGRKEPGTGEINYRNIFKYLHEDGYDGVIGMEHGISQGGKEGELKLIKAYRDADNF